VSNKEDIELVNNNGLIIRADASTEIGSGHLMRCLALAQAWKDAGGRVTFITTCQSDGLLQRLRDEGFDISLLARPYPDPGDWEYTKDVLATYASAWVVLDGYHFDEVYQQGVKETGNRLLVIDDMAHLKRYYANILLNQNLHAEQSHYSCEPHTQMLLGTHYVLLRREFLAWKDWKREVPEVARRVLVTLGGGDPENYTLKVLQALQKVDTSGLEATVIIGASNPHADILEAGIKESHIPIHLVHDAKNMPELMAQADVAVSSAGSTVWESAFMGLPSIVLVLADNQQLIAKSLDELGAVLNLGWYTGVTSTDIRRTLARLLGAVEVRAEMAQQGQHLVDGEGGRRVISTMVAEVGGVNADCLSGE
jgi:UDP-2,4-diacetamido-2,4,6-trideoxy-beta-L-altropyranose hydrolase